MKTNLREATFFCILLYMLTYIVWGNLFKFVIYLPILVGVCIYVFELKLRVDSEHILFGIFALYTVFNAFYFYSSDIRLVYGLYQYIFYALAMFYFLWSMPFVEIRSVTKFILGISFITSVISIYEFLTGDFVLLRILPMIQGDMVFQANVGADSAYRAISLMGSPLTLGLICALYALLAYHLFVTKGVYLFLVLAAINLGGMICTMTRGAYVSFLVGFMFYNLALLLMDAIPKTAKLRIISLLMVGLISVICLIAFADDSIFINRIVSIVDLDGSNTTDYSNALRMVFWLQALGIWVHDWESLFFGIGVAATGNSPNTYTITESGLLKRLVEGGIVMFTLYYAMLANCFYKGYRVIKKSEYLRTDIVIVMALALAILTHDVALQITEQVNFSLLLWLNMSYLIYQYNTLRDNNRRGKV